MTKRKRFTNEQIWAAVDEFEAGKATGIICRENNISLATFYNWRARWLAVKNNDAAITLQLKDEIALLKKIVLELTIENHALKKELMEKDRY